MKVTRLPKDPGVTGWNAVLPPAGAAQVLEGTVTADWLVIGAGFAGLAAARRLAELHRGDRVVLLEAARVGEGPAGRNSGFMIDLPHDLASDDYGGAVESDLAQTRGNRAAIAYAAEMAAEYGLSGEAFALSGKTNAAATPKGDAHIRDYAAHLARMGEAHEVLGAQEMQEMTGTHYYTSGLYTPGAAMLQPAMFVRDVAAGLQSNRVQVFEQSPVTGLTRNGVWRAQTPQGEVQAPRVILAVNGHANSFGQFEGQFLHVFTYASMTRALQPDEVARLGGAPVWGVTPADPMGTTVRRVSGVGGDRLLIRNRFTCDPSMEVDDLRISAVGRDHDKSFEARFDMLRGVEMEYRWGGRLCLSLNNVPALGEREEGLFVAACQNGLGVAKGILHGKLMAEMASGQSSDLLEDAMAQDAPKRLPPKPLTWLGANAVMRWRERRAGGEL